MAQLIYIFRYLYFMLNINAQFGRNVLNAFLKFWLIWASIFIYKKGSYKRVHKNNMMLVRKKEKSAAIDIRWTHLIEH